MKRVRLSKKWLIVLATVVLIVGAGSVAYAAGALSFTDVPEGYWAYDSIAKMAAQGVVKGHADGSFGPEEAVTRAQVVTFLDRSQGVCTQCHNAGTVLTEASYAWGHTLHATGESFLEDGTRKDCAGCHSGGGFSAMVAAGQKPNQVPAGDPNPTPVDCRACHQIHESLTAADWGLETEAPVAFYALTATYDGGMGNLCANCHQFRRAFPAATDGKIAVTERFGPHHGPETAMLLGIGGAGAVTGAPSAHYSMVSDTCVTCHMGADATHTFEPNVAACTPCHAGAEDFDIGDTQTEVQAMLDELETALKTAGLLDAEAAIVAGSYTEAQAAALWNYLYVAREDGSLGVHNPAYTKALLQAALDAL